MQEHWKTIPDFPNYEVSNLGRIYNSKWRQMMVVGVTNHGHARITLTTDAGFRFTRSATRIVAEAFVESPSFMCDNVIVLDGNFRNIEASNLAWRPAWFMWKYTRQLKTDQPRHYHNLAVQNLVTGVVYESIIDAGKTEGLLFEDIWESTYNGKQVFPYGHSFEIVERV